MGIYEVSEANRKVRTLELKGYDHMLRFEKTLKLESSSGTPYQFLKAACDACKVEMAQTVAEISVLPNGKTTLGIYSDNDIETFRDLVFYVAQVLDSAYLGPIMVAAYSYMALVPIIQPPVIKLCTTKKERLIRMKYHPGEVTKLTKILFPIVITIVAGVVAPQSAA